MSRQPLRWAFGNLNTLPNCLLGVHDGPKVVMPGDRLANGAGVSRQTKGPVNNQRLALLVRTAVTKAALGNPSLGIDTTATAGSEYMVRAHATVREVAGPSPAQDHRIPGSSVNPLALTFVAIEA